MTFIEKYQAINHIQKITELLKDKEGNLKNYKIVIDFLNETTADVYIVYESEDKLQEIRKLVNNLETLY